MRQAKRALVYSVAIATLSACAGKVNTHPEGSYLGSGAYRSRTVSDAGGNGYRLELKSSGQFNLKTFVGSCLVGESSGLWHSSPEFLDLTTRETRHRDGCGTPWRATPADDLLSCPIRKTSNRSFQMIHEEISQGTRWTDWKMATDRNFEGLAEETAQAGSPEQELSANIGEKSGELP